MQGFLNIKQIVEDSGNDWRTTINALAEKIDTKGIFLLGKYYSPNSRQAQTALMLLAALHDTCLWSGSERANCDPVSEEIDNIAPGFGWPAAEMPDLNTADRGAGWMRNFFRFKWVDEFKDSPVPHWVRVPRDTLIYFEELYSVSRIILTNRATTAELANEIERGGLYFFESAGRLKKYDFDHPSHKCQDVIDGLTSVHDEQYTVDQYPTYQILKQPRFCKAGWPYHEIPEFLQRRLGLESVDPVEYQKSSEQVELGVESAKSTNRDSLAIAILVAYLEGTLTGEPHPHFSERSGQAKLIKFIDKIKIKFRLRGLGERQFKDVFSEAHERIPPNVLKELKLEFRKELGLPLEDSSEPRK